MALYVPSLRLRLGGCFLAQRSLTHGLNEVSCFRLRFCLVDAAGTAVDNVQSSGVPAAKVRSILIVPEFFQKVLNSAVIELRVTLLRFNREL